MKRSLSLFALATLLWVAGCQSSQSDKNARPAAPIPPSEQSTEAKAAPVEGTGVELLRSVLRKYGETKSFRATSEVTWIFDEQQTDSVKMERAMLMEPPGKYRVMTLTGNLKSIAISDGTTSLEETNSEAFLYNAAPTIWEANAVMISNENYCGSLLYPFFGGENALLNLLSEENRRVELFDGKKDGELQLRFVAKAPYGSVELTVLEESLEITQISAKMEPKLLEMKEADLGSSPRSIQFVEQFTNRQFNAKISPEAFKTSPSAGLKVRDRREEAGVNTPAPMFEVPSLSGKTVSLKSLRDQVVVLLFLDSLNRGSQNALNAFAELEQRIEGEQAQLFVVMTEPKELVQVFMNEQSSDQEVLLDLDKKVFKDYRVLVTEQDGGQSREVLEVPSLIVIDRRGRIVDRKVAATEFRMMLEGVRSAGIRK